MGEATNVVYYIGTVLPPSGVGAVKIGTTENVVRRIWQLRRDRPDAQLVLLATEPGGYDLERRRHIEFAGARLTGEWFALSPRLEYHIARLSDPDLPPDDAPYWEWNEANYAAVNRLAWPTRRPAERALR